MNIKTQLYAVDCRFRFLVEKKKSAAQIYRLEMKFLSERKRNELTGVVHPLHMWMDRIVGVCVKLKQFLDRP